MDVDIKVSICLQAFKNYDEAGAVRRIQCLKYLVLANMLMESSVDPFDAQEAKPYKGDGEVLAMTNLVNAYQENNIKEFEKILRTNKSVPSSPCCTCLPELACCWERVSQMGQQVLQCTLVVFLSWGGVDRLCHAN